MMTPASTFDDPQCFELWRCVHRLLMLCYGN